MWTAKKSMNMKRRTFIGLSGAAMLSFAMLVSMPAQADQLDDLRMSGALGEAYDGFTRARAASAESYSASVNEKRRKIYIKRAKSQGASTEQVGKVYATQIASKAPKGTWFLSESGKWSQK